MTTKVIQKICIFHFFIKNFYVTTQSLYYLRMTVSSYTLNNFADIRFKNYLCTFKSIKDMATYQVYINERMAFGKSILAMLQSAPVEAVTIESPPKKGRQKKSKLYKNLQSAFRDVREIMDGKQPRVTLDEFLNEIRNSTD
jgi:hypothetical protein